MQNNKSRIKTLKISIRRNLILFNRLKFYKITSITVKDKLRRSRDCINIPTLYDVNFFGSTVYMSLLRAM